MKLTVIKTDDPAEALGRALPDFEIPFIDLDQIGNGMSLEAEKTNLRPNGASIDREFIIITPQKRGKRFKITY